MVHLEDRSLGKKGDERRGKKGFPGGETGTETREKGQNGKNTTELQLQAVTLMKDASWQTENRKRFMRRH